MQIECFHCLYYKSHRCRNEKSCPEGMMFIEYTGSIVRQCLYATVEVFQDDYIHCPIIEEIGCAECEKKFGDGSNWEYDETQNYERKPEWKTEVKEEVNNFKTMEGSKIKNISITQLHPHIDNPRKDLGDLTELAESIKSKGVLQNLTVVPRIFGSKTDFPTQDGYTVVIGHRRLAAAKLAGLTELPCVISDMDYHDQIATMLLENIQRNDLTVLEQAKGFQMMIDLGDTEKDIAARTGFSETTVKHRLKLNQLDKKKLVDAQLRGGRIEDFIKLEQIKDIKLRNKVLETIGTPSFKWSFENAIEEEARPERKKKLNEFFQTFAKPAPESMKGLEYVDSFYGFKLGNFKKPKDADTVEYYYSFSDYSATLYKKRSEEDKPEPKLEELEFNERKAKLEELAKRSYKMRSEFVKNFASVKKYAANIHAFAFSVMIKCGGININKLLQWLNIPDPPKGTSYVDALEMKQNAALAKYKENPERTMLYTAYLSTDDGPHRNYFNAQSWKGYKITHVKSERLDLIYDALIDLGYEMSEEEQRLRDGTHELYDAEVPDEDALPSCETVDCPFNNSNGHCCFRDENPESEGYHDDIKDAIEIYACENDDVNQVYEEITGEEAEE